MAITFNNIPNTTRTPNVYAEIDNSRALQGLASNPHKALIIGQKISAGSVSLQTLIAITRDNLADGYFGTGSELARMCNVFKNNNPNTELYAIAVSAGGAAVQASAFIDFDIAMNSADLSYAGTYYLMINGTEIPIALTSGMSGKAIGSTVMATVNGSTYSYLPVTVSTGTTSAGSVFFSAVCSGTQGNYINIRANYYTGESTIRTIFAVDPIIVSMAGGTVGGDLDDVWSVVEGEQFHYIIQPYIDAANLTSIENELADRFDPTEDLQGHGFTAVRGTQASCTTLGNSRNSPHNTIMGCYDSPTAPEEWAAALGAVAAKYLNIDPARPLHFLKLKGILPPPVESRFTRAERELLLYDGIATSITDTGGNQVIERCITTYQANALGLPDWSYLDVQTMATLGEIRYQFKTRMSNRFISPRFKLADDGFNIQPGSYVATPSLVKDEIIALFLLLRDRGLIENIEDFKENLVVERDTADANRINALLNPNLINQFRVLAGLIQFIL